MMCTPWGYLRSQFTQIVFLTGSASVYSIIRIYCLSSFFVRIKMFGIIKFILRKIMRRYTVTGAENIDRDREAIFVCNHAGFVGPLAMGLYFPLRFRPWVIYRAITAGLCRKQLEKDLFGDYHTFFKPFCRAAAFMIEPACLWAMRKIKAIPVHRGKNEIFATFKQSVEALSEGYNLILFPENDESEYHSRLKDFYTGFVHIARKYCNEKGVTLSFHPVYISGNKRSIAVGKPVAYNPQATFKSESERIVNALMKAIRQCADSTE